MVDVLFCIPKIFLCKTSYLLRGCFFLSVWGSICSVYTLHVNYWDLFSSVWGSICSVYTLHVNCCVFFLSVWGSICSLYTLLVNCWVQCVTRVGQNRITAPNMTVIWWIPCQKNRIYTVHVWFWPTLHLSSIVYTEHTLTWTRKRRTLMATLVG